MDVLRLILFSGLLLHKVLWEVLKRRDRDLGVGQHSGKNRGTEIVKLIKSIVLLFLLCQTLFLDLFPISEHPATLRVIGAAIYFAGLAIAVIGRLQLGKNWVDLEDYQVIPGQSLVTYGIYRYIRHPIYAGDILLIVGLELALNSWLVLGAFIPLFIAIRQASAEEALLSQVFPAYSAYCRQTKRFIPYIL
ncbi:MAG: methyltransferase family protein [Gammaproteobacteria bacterium]